MPKPKITPWFPGNVKPVRVGVYERAYHAAPTTPTSCLWDGNRWCSPDTTDKPSLFQALPWRGLAEPPK